MLKYQSQQYQQQYQNNNKKAQNQNSLCSEPYSWHIDFKCTIYRAWIEQDIVHCDAQSVKDGWMAYSSEFMVGTGISETL